MLFMIKSTKQIKVANIKKLETYDNSRDCYFAIKDFVQNKKSKGKICALYGIRRTGKTVLLTQLAKDLQKQGEKCLYLVCSDEHENIEKDKENNSKHIPEIDELFELLEQAIDENYKYVFIDELSFMKDFIGQGNILSNYYCDQGLNIIATGTDSLSFAIVKKDNMLDRLKEFRTSYVSFGEYYRLLNKGLEDYIEYGGTLKEESPYKDISSTIEYTNTAVVNNIIRSLKNSEHTNKNALTLLYSEEVLISTINRCIDQMNQKFIISAINKNNGIFESHSLYLGLHNAKDYPFSLYIDVVSVDEQVKESLSILNKDEMACEMKQQDIDVIKNALAELDLVLAIPSYLSLKNNVKDNDVEIVSQSGMMYCHSTELTKVLANDENWHKLEKCGLDNKEKFIHRVDRQVKGDILENLILYDTYQALKDNYYVSKLHLNTSNKEVDVIVVDKKTKETYLFEVKYADYVDSEQTKNLSNSDFNEYIKENFGEVKGRYLIYNGERTAIKDELGTISYIKAEEYLKNIVHCNSIQDLLFSCHIEKELKNNDIDKKPPANNANIDSATQDRLEDFYDKAKKVLKDVSEIVAKREQRVQYSFEHIAKQVEHNSELSR